MTAWRKTSLVWEVTDTTTLVAVAPGVTDPTVKRVIYVPANAGEDVVFQNGSSENAIVLKAGAADASPITVDFSEGGLRVPGLQCTTIDGGTAYVYLK
jgi:hypothetical protein